VPNSARTSSSKPVLHSVTSDADLAIHPDPTD
jgi:hypothetical protein